MKRTPEPPYVYVHDRDETDSAPRAPRPEPMRSVGRRSRAATRPSTGNSFSPSAPPASIAGRAALRGRRSGRMCRSTPRRRRRSGRGIAPASAAGPTSSARPIRGSRRCGARAKGSRRRRRRLSSPTSRRGRASARSISIACSRRSTGVTPKAYAAQMRARRAADGLRTADTVTEAIYGAGFNSSSRFYESAAARLGMTPTAVRRGGEGGAIRFAIGQGSLGAVLVAATEKGVCAIMLGDDPEALARELQDRFPRAELVGGDVEFERMVARVVGLIEAPGAASGPSARHPRDCVPGARLAGAPRHSSGQDGDLRRDRQGRRAAQGRARGRSGLRRQSAGGRDPLPPGGADRRRPVRLSLGRRTQARVARS